MFFTELLRTILTVSKKSINCESNRVKNPYNEPIGHLNLKNDQSKKCWQYVKLRHILCTDQCYHNRTEADKVLDQWFSSQTRWINRFDCRFFEIISFDNELLSLTLLEILIDRIWRLHLHIDRKSVCRERVLAIV